MNTKKTTARPFWGSDRVPPKSGGQTSVFHLFDSEQKTNTRKTTPRPFLGSDRVPPTAGGQTDDFWIFVNHVEMHACAHADAHAHMHTYIFTPTSTHEMRTRTHVQRHCLRPYANAITFLMQTLGRCLAALENGRRGPKAASSNFEHKPLNPENGVKVTTALHFWSIGTIFVRRS